MKTDTLAFITHLPRERVIALLGSTARLDYKPAPVVQVDEKAYWLEGQQPTISRELDRDEPRIVALHLLGITNLEIGLAWGVSRECIASRLRRMGYVGNPNGTGRCRKDVATLTRRHPPPNRATQS